MSYSFVPNFSHAASLLYDGIKKLSHLFNIKDKIIEALQKRDSDFILNLEEEDLQYLYQPLDSDNNTALHLLLNEMKIDSSIENLIGVIIDKIPSEKLEEALHSPERICHATPLNLLIAYGYTNIIKQLFNRSFDLTKESNNATPLSDAVQYKQPEILKFLLDNKIEDKTYLALYKAVLNDEVQMVAELLNSMQKPNLENYRFHGNSLLHIAAINKNVRMVSLLLDSCPALLNEQVIDEKNNGATALHYAVFAECTRLANLLISSGIDLHLKMKTGKRADELTAGSNLLNPLRNTQYAFWDAIQNNNLASVRTMLKNNSWLLDFPLGDGDQARALHVAIYCANDNTDIIQHILKELKSVKNSEAVNYRLHKNSLGTPLELAILLNPSVIPALHQAGARLECQREVDSEKFLGKKYNVDILFFAARHCEDRKPFEYIVTELATEKLCEKGIACNETSLKYEIRILLQSKDAHNNTLLHHAINRGKATQGLLEFLLEYVDPCERNDLNKLPEEVFDLLQVDSSTGTFLGFSYQKPEKEYLNQFGEVIHYIRSKREEKEIENRQKNPTITISRVETSHVSLSASLKNEVVSSNRLATQSRGLPWQTTTSIPEGSFLSHTEIEVPINQPEDCLGVEINHIEKSRDSIEEYSLVEESVSPFSIITPSEIPDHFSDTYSIDEESEPASEQDEELEKTDQIAKPTLSTCTLQTTLVDEQGQLENTVASGQDISIKENLINISTSFFAVTPQENDHFQQHSGGQKNMGSDNKEVLKNIGQYGLEMPLKNSGIVGITSVKSKHKGSKNAHEVGDEKKPDLIDFTPNENYSVSNFQNRPVLSQKILPEATDDLPIGEDNSQKNRDTSVSKTQQKIIKHTENQLHHFSEKAAVVAVQAIQVKQTKKVSDSIKDSSGLSPQPITSKKKVVINAQNTSNAQTHSNVSDSLKYHTALTSASHDPKSAIEKNRIFFVEQDIASFQTLIKNIEAIVNDYVSKEAERLKLISFEKAVNVAKDSKQASSVDFIQAIDVQLNLMEKTGDFMEHPPAPSCPLAALSPPLSRGEGVMVVDTENTTSSQTCLDHNNYLKYYNPYAEFKLLLNILSDSRERLITIVNALNTGSLSSDLARNELAEEFNNIRITVVNKLTTAQPKVEEKKLSWWEQKLKAIKSTLAKIFPSLFSPITDDSQKVEISQNDLTRSLQTMEKLIETWAAEHHMIKIATVENDNLYDSSNDRNNFLECKLNPSPEPVSRMESIIQNFSVLFVKPIPLAEEYSAEERRKNRWKECPHIESFLPETQPSESPRLKT
jgi:ankyrin repeat protein